MTKQHFGPQHQKWFMYLTSGLNFLKVQIHIGPYAYLRHKNQLGPFVGIQLTFSHIRASNFPTIRLARLAQLFIKYQPYLRGH